MHRTLNVKFLLCLILGLAVASGGVALAHHLQYRRIPLALLKQAQKAEDENDLVRADSYLTRYLDFEPTDVEQKARLARLLTGKKLEGVPGIQSRAYFLLMDVLARDPEQQELRRVFIPLAIQVGRLPAAEEQLRLLPAGGDTAGLWGRWYEAKDQDERAIESYREAVKQVPGDSELVSRLVRLLRSRRWENLSPDNTARKYEADVREADRAIDEMVRAAGDSWEARVARWNYYRDYYLGERRGERRSEFVKMIFSCLVQHAARDVTHALAVRAGEPEVRLAAAEAAALADELDRARDHLAKARQLHREDPRIYRALASIELQAEQNVKSVDPKDDASVKEAVEKRKAFRTKAINWLRQGAQELKQPAQGQLQWALAMSLLDTGTPKELEEASRVIARVRQVNMTPAGADFLQGRLLMARQQWAEAAELLERAGPKLQTPAELANQIDLYLGQCYEELNKPDQQFTAFDRLLKRNPASIAARLGIARAKEALGQYNEAIRQYDHLAQTPDLPHGIWANQMRLHIVKAQHTRSTDDWKRVEQALEAGRERSGVDPVELAVLRAESLLAQDKGGRAVEILEEARKAHPDRVEVFVALAGLAERRRDLNAARRILDEADEVLKKPSDQVELLLARAGYLVKKRDGQTQAALAKLSADLERFKKHDRNRLLQGLGESHYRAGNLAEAARLWKDLSTQEEYQADLRLRLVLFDLALQEGKDKDMESALQEIRRVEGGSGTFGQHAEALRLLWLVKKEKVTGGKRDDTLAEADRLVTQVMASRPTWTAALMARAEIETLRGNHDRAIDAYRKARQSGDRSPVVLRQLIDLLRKQHKDEEASKILQAINPEDLAPDLQRAAANIAIVANDTDRGISLALKAFREDSRDYRDYLWYGKLLASAGRKPEEAEKAFRKAIQLETAEAEPWVSLVRFFIAQNRKKDAEELLPTARGSIKDGQKQLAMAQCYSLLDRPADAKNMYEEALKARPADAAVLADYAGFHLQRNEIKEAEALLRRLLETDVKMTQEESEWAHGRLALILSAEEDFSRFKQALPHVGLRMDESGDVIRDESLVRSESLTMKRLAAHVLAGNSQWRTRTEAIKRLEELEQRQALTAEDRFLLARLYEARNDWPKARTQYNQLALARDRKAQHLVAYAQSLLSNREFSDAQRTINRLKELHQAKGLPGGEVVLLELQARWHEARNEGKQAETLLRERLKNADASPAEVLLLVSSLGRQNRFADALGELERIWKACPPEMAGGTSVALLRSTKPTDRQREQVESYLEAARKKEPRNVALLVQLGDVKDLAGNYQAAEELYREALKLAPGNVMTLNNLAWLLALRAHKGEQALELINKAIELSGPRGELLDTRAVVYLMLDKPDQARADVQDALKEAVTAVRTFHLAQAHNLANDRKAAAQALRQAADLGLQPDHLHPVEQVAYRKIHEELGER